MHTNKNATLHIKKWIVMKQVFLTHRAQKPKLSNNRRGALIFDLYGMPEPV
jgi:hypothetical protein